MNSTDMRTILPSELIINPDGSVFHLHLKPEQIADTIILVGDPARVDLVAARFDTRELRTSNREFVAVTGTYRRKRMTVLSTGIGTDNIDIVATELDALANVDFATRRVRPASERRQLTMLRLGTSGALQPDLSIGDLVFARTSVGMDGLLNFYEGRDSVCDLEMERALTAHTGWSERLAAPYCVDADAGLYELFRPATKAGITVSAPGFYAPQGRQVRLRPAFPDLNERMESFEWRGLRITNLEMESSALAGLAALMGHRAATICTIIAQRIAGKAMPDYRPFVERMIDLALERLAV
jgi:uridine phosphorylase